MITYTGFSWVQVLTLLVSVVLPALVALVTNRMASPGLKAVTLAALAAVVGFLSELLHAVVTALSFDVGTALLTWLTSFIIAVAAHYGLLKPTGLTGSTGVIASAVPGGLGADAPGKHTVAALQARLEAERRAA